MRVDRRTDGERDRERDRQKSGHDEALLASALRKRPKIYGRRCIIGTTILCETNVLDCQKEQRKF